MESADKDFGNVTVTGNITTGNIKTNGYYFANGTPVPFGVTYGNSNVATFLAAYGSNTISTTGNVTSGNFLTSGVVSATGNITGNYFLGNGSQLTGISSTTNALINGDNSFVLDVNGNVVFEGDGAGQAVNRGLVWDYGAVANGVNSQVRQDNDGLTVQAWTENSGNYAASVNIVTNQDANTNTWIFNGNGNLILPGDLRLQSGNIVTDSIDLAFNSAITGITTGNATVIVTLADSVFGDPVQGEVTISSVTGTTEANGVWGYEVTDPNEFQLYTDATLTTPVDGTTWTTYVSGGTAVSVGTYTDLTIQGGNVSISSNDNTWTFDTTGNLTVPNAIIGTATILIDNRASGNSADIQLYSADDIVLQARDRTLGSGTEGGDINIYAGDSAEDGDTSGGDIQIRAGDGGAGNTDYGGSGGTITIQSGRGGAAIGNTGATAESGGSLTLNAGDAGDNNGNIDLGSDGGDVYIESGFSTGNTNNGGDIYLTTGTGGQNGASGIVQVNIPGYGLTTGGTWTFDPNGQINIPADSNSFGTGRIQSANGYPTFLGYGSGEHGGPELDWTDGNDPTDIGNASVLRNTLYINDGGLYVGMNENAVANVAAPSWRFNPNGTTIFPTLEVDLHNGGVQTGQVLQFGDTGQQAIITGPAPAVDTNAQRLIIQGQVGNGTGEGGDVYLWAGDAQNNGGDIKIYAGDADNASAGSGGYVNIDGGAGFDDGGAITLTGGTSANGTGGTVNIDGGSGNIGGNVGIQAGYGQAGPGGAVTIIGGGSANGLAEYGNVTIGTGASEWKFDNTGNLTLPGGTFAVNYANGDPVTFSGGGANTGNVTFDDITIIGTGNLKLQPDSANADAYLDIYLTSGPDIHIAGNGETVILGTDDFANVTVNVDGNVSIQSGNASGTHTWNFDTAGNLTLPRGGIVYETNIPDGGLNGNTIALAPSGGTNADQQLLIYPTVTDANHLHLTSGNLYNTELYLGSDDLYVKLANTGNIVINTNDNVGNTHQWSFDYLGTMYIPGNIKVTPNNDLDVKLYNANASSNVSFTVQNRQVDISNAVTTQFDVAGNSIVLSTDVNTNNYQWTFDDTGNLTAPGVVTASEFSTSGSGGDITMSSGNITGANVVSANTVSSTGNVTGVYIKGNGSELTNLPAPVVTQDIASNGAMSIMTYDGNIKYASYATVEPSSGNIAGGNISTSGNVTTAGSVVTTPIALANLTAIAGGRAFVNNGNLAAVGNFGAQIGSGGSNIVPVWSDGTNWYIG
jgi:hypothetical protein